MKLQSKFDDFYDWCANTYRDEEVFYKRDTNVITFSNYKDPDKKEIVDYVNKNTSGYRYMDSYDSVFAHISLYRNEPKLKINEDTLYKIEDITKSFCIIANQAYPIYSISIGGGYTTFDNDNKNSIIKYNYPNYVDDTGVFSINKPQNTEGNDEKYKRVGSPLVGFNFSTFESFYKFLKKHTNVLSYDQLNQKIKKLKTSLNINQQDIDKIRKISKEPVVYVVLNRGWIAAKRIPEIIENPRLVDLDLHNLIDSQKVYQDIMMHISAFKEPKDIVSIEDKHILEGKGFNEKSFRKESNKPKRRNKNINKP